MISQIELGIIGESSQIRELVAVMRQIAPTDLTVLLSGESGVGKEVFAHAIHRLSNRSRHKMISLNCGAIPQMLLESELFGHEKGAFTGAVETRKGLFEAADGGTIFLDEVGEMSPATQVKLLRVLETLEFTRVGGTEVRKTDVRVIAATNRDLQEAMQRGEFRHDLYYRLRAVQLVIPPLRERIEDIPLLVEHFARRTCDKLGITFTGITFDAVELLKRYPWEGNIRELRNFIELAVTLEKGTEITPETVMMYLHPERRMHTTVEENPRAIVHLPGRTSEQVERELIYRALLELRSEVSDLKKIMLNVIDSQTRPAEPYPALPAPEPTLADVLKSEQSVSLASVEKQLIEVVLRRYHGNRRHAARALGISERTLYRKIAEHGLDEVGFVDNS